MAAKRLSSIVIKLLHPALRFGKPDVNRPRM
ncbi:hypothetical protein J729_4651, partial [Acinetobacter baumannii 929679-598]